MANKATFRCFRSAFRMRKYITMIDRMPLIKIISKASVCEANLMKSVFRGLVREFTKE